MRYPAQQLEDAARGLEDAAVKATTDEARDKFRLAATRLRAVSRLARKRETQRAVDRRYREANREKLCRRMVMARSRVYIPGPYKPEFEQLLNEFVDTKCPLNAFRRELQTLGGAGDVECYYR
jgi:hypothetical protein